MENTLQKALQHRLRSHPEDFHDVIHALNITYKNICHTRDTRPKDALVQLKDLIQTFNTLLDLPTDIKLPIPNETWRSQLHQIIEDCQKKCENLQKLLAIASNNSQHGANLYDMPLPDTMLAPWIQDWLDPTLQTRAVKRLVYHTIVPIMFPSAHAAAFPNKPTSSKDTSYPHMILLTGPSHTGKSYTIQAVRRYLKDHQAPVRWVIWSAFECVNAAQQQLKNHASRPSSNSGLRNTPTQSEYEHESIIPNEWTVFVTDNASSQDFAQWTEQPWFRAWDQWLSKQPRTLWIASVTMERDANELDGLSQGVPVQIPFKYPDGRTVYHLFRKLLLRQYGHVRLQNGTLEPPSYARLPIIHEFDRLASLCDHIATSNVSFATIEKVFQHTVRHCTRLAMLENVVYKQPGIEWWYPKNSVKLAALKPDYDYRLIYPLVHDKIEWCPAKNGQTPTQCSVDATTFWNVQLLDTLPTSEYERLAHVYMDPDSVHDKKSPTYQVIANFPVKTRVFPYHLHDGFDRCYEWTIAMWLATVAKNKASARIYRTLLSTDDVCTLPSSAQDAFFNASTLPLQFEDVTDAHQILYIEHKTNDDDTLPIDSRAIPNVHIYNDERSSLVIDEFKHGVPGNVDATTMQKILQVVLNNLDVDVIQVQTHAGYAYYIDVGNVMEHPLRVEAVDPETTRVSLMPRVTLLATSGGPHLDATYRLTCESDVDALTEAYPREYRDVFREEESTWKLMKPRDPSHLAHLNCKYSHETKFYLKIFGDLLQAKRRHYSCLNFSQRKILDHSIVDMQNFLDYHLLLIGENNQNGDWNEVWSMSPTHPTYEAYHPPAHNEVDKVVAVDLAMDWMKKDMQYFVSPRWLEPFYMLATNFNGKLRHMTTHESDSIVALSPMQHLFRTWKWYKHEPVKENTHWIYVKSVVDKQAWSDSIESTSCLKRAFPYIDNTTTLPEAFGGSPGHLNRGGHQESSVDDVYISSKHTTNLPRQSTDSVLPCLQDASYMQTYTSRTTKSLFHTLIRHASYLGRHDEKENVIHWYEIKQGREDDPLDTTVAHLGRHQEVWALLSKNCTYGHAVCHPWLFALNMCSLCEGKPGVPVPPKGAHLNYHELYAHLLAFPTLHYWSLEGGDNVLMDIQEQGIWDHTVCQYAFVHKHVHRRPLPLHGPFPQSFERNCVVPTTHVSLTPSTSHGKKSVIPDDALSKIHVYGCSIHHLEDCWNKMMAQ